MERWHYTYAGLRITSELPIPEWAVFAQPAALDDVDVDVRIAVEGVQTVGVSEATEARDVCTTAAEHCFRVSEVGAYRVRHGREIAITPAPDAGSREVRLFLLGSAWGALCYQRGLLALHASVVQTGEGAIAFCGATGAGKSSVAAGMVARGYRLIGDDLCRFEVADGMARVYPAAPRLKLWRDALAAFGRSAEDLERDHYRMDKFHVTDLTPSQPLRVVQGKPARSVPLRAIYLLAWSEDPTPGEGLTGGERLTSGERLTKGELGITRLTGITALRRLVAAATYRGELLEPMGQGAAHWQRCAELARRVPVYQFTRPHAWATFEAGIDMLIAHSQHAFDDVETP